MDIKSYLEGIRTQDEKIHTMREELETVRRSLGIKGVSYDNTGASASTPAADAMAEVIAEIIDFEKEIEQEECRLAVMRLKAVSMINKLSDDKEREVLRRWYLLFECEEDIKKAMKCSRTTVYNCRRRGLEKLVQICTK